MNSETTTDGILKRKEAQANDLERLKVACSSVFSSKEGIVLGKILYDICIIQTTKANNLSVEQLSYDKGRRNVYEILQNFIPDEARFEIEIKKGAV